MARKKNNGINKAVWLGEVVEKPEFSHEITENGGTVQKFYKFSIRTKVVTNKGKELDESVLPMIVSEKVLEKLEKPVEVGDTVFIRGSWRTYSVKKEDNRRRVEQVGFVHSIEHSELRNGKYLNRFNFRGYLVDKLYVPMRDENRNLIRDEKTGKFVPLLKDGQKQWTVRRNREGKIVNDFTIAINTNNRSFYIPCISYYKLAKKVADEFNIGEEVKGSGYIRSRTYTDKEGKERTVYEAVVVLLEKVVEETENPENPESRE